MTGKNIKKISFVELLAPANVFRVVCIDERRVKEENRTNPVNLPGGIYALIDTLKALYHYSETEAWQAVAEVRIPIGAHIDDHLSKKGEGLGCGYARLVETAPEKVYAVEPVKSVERLITVNKLGGEILHYIGSHSAKYAVLNYRQGFSLDQDQLPALGIFSGDVWAAKYYASFINQYDSRIDPDMVARHIEKVFRATVKVLTAGKIANFIVIK